MKSKVNCLVPVLLFFGLLPVALHAQNAELYAAAPDSSLYLKVQLVESKMKPPSQKPRDILEGTLTRSVYWHENEVFPTGSHIRLVVDHLEQRRRLANDHWPWAIKAFTPRHEKYPTFRSAQVLLPDGRTIDLQVSLLSITQEVVVRARSRKKEPQSHTGGATEATLTPTSSSNQGRSKSKTPAGLIANLQAFVNAADFLTDSDRPPSLFSAEPMTVPAGTHARVLLLNGVSASGSHLGDAFQARLIEPIFNNSTVVLPAGSVLEGRIAKARKPRMLSRSGSLLLSFTSITNPDGMVKRIDASVAGISVDRHSRDTVDPEGEIQGERPGAAWKLINLGVTGGLAKAVDDSTQLIMQAIVSAATDASTAGTSRIVAACVSGVFMLTRHGRDVVLPKFTEVDITFNRPVVVTVIPPSGNGREPAQSRSEQ